VSFLRKVVTPAKAGAAIYVHTKIIDNQFFGAYYHFSILLPSLILLKLKAVNTEESLNENSSIAALSTLFFVIIY